MLTMNAASDPLQPLLHRDQTGNAQQRLSAVDADASGDADLLNPDSVGIRRLRSNACAMVAALISSDVDPGRLVPNQADDFAGDFKERSVCGGCGQANMVRPTFNKDIGRRGVAGSWSGKRCLRSFKHKKTGRKSDPSKSDTVRCLLSSTVYCGITARSMRFTIRIAITNA